MLNAVILGILVKNKTVKVQEKECLNTKFA